MPNADGYMTIQEIAAIVGMENQAILPPTDPIMILLTLCRILQKEAVAKTEEIQNNFFAELEEKLLQVEAESGKREKQHLEQALKAFDGLTRQQLADITKNAEKMLKESSKSIINEVFLPHFAGEIRRVKVICFACLGSSVLVVLASLVLAVSK